MFEAIQAFDDALLHFVQNALLGGTVFFDAVSLLGHPLVWLLAAAFLHWSSRENHGFFLVNLTVFSAAASGMLKLAFVRPRPSPSEFAVFPEPAFLERLGRSAVNAFSFPSGHATLIASVVSFYWKKMTASWKATAVVVAALVALSRLVLGVHFLSDVLAGIAIGIAIGKFAHWIQSELESHHFKLSKGEDLAALLSCIGVALGAVALFEPPAWALSLLGYYAGFFGAKEQEFVQLPVRRDALAVKCFFGLLGLSALAGLAFNEPSAGASMVWWFASGFWVSLAWPFIFDHAHRKRKQTVNRARKKAH